MTNLTKLLTGRFHGRNHVGQPALRRTASTDVYFLNSQTWRHVGEGARQATQSSAPHFPQKRLSPGNRGIVTRGRVNSGVANAIFCLHGICALAQPLFTLKIL